MTARLLVRAAGPQITVQDLGRPGHLAVGLSRGGAADRTALLEAAALLGQDPGLAALELAGAGGSFEVTEPVRIALTGAPMRTMAGDRPLAWHAAHRLDPGTRLAIGSPEAGSYGYLSVAGGIATPLLMGSRATHRMARIGRTLEAGDEIPLGGDPFPGRPPLTLDAPDRFRGGTVRVVPGGQTAMFPEAQRARFAATTFTRDLRGNRQGVRLAFDGDPFGAEGGRSVLSEIITPGDIQMTGEGTPFVLLPECQTTGGYPRIASVLPEDLPIVAQAAPGTALRFAFLSLEEARAAWRSEADRLAVLKASVRPLIRDPRDIPDLLGYQLISGATAGDTGDKP